MNENITEKVHRYLQLSETLLHGETAAKRREWEAIARIMAPELLEAAGLRENTTSYEYERGCAAAVECADKLTGACVSYITPMGHRWFRFSSWSNEVGSDMSEDEKAELDMWFVKISDIVQEAVERSNFYGQIVAAFYDFVVTGTAAMFCGVDKEEARLNFYHIPAGTYGLDKNSKGRPTTLTREYTMTAYQLREMFPRAEFPGRVQSAWDNLSKRYTDRFDVVHIVAPRDGYKKANYNEFEATTYPFISMFILKDDKWLLEENGYKEFPYLVLRYSVSGNQVFGTSPFVRGKDIIYDIREMESVALEDAKKKVAPPVLVPAEMAGQVNLEAGGETIVPTVFTNASLPREWGVGGEVRDLLLHLERLEQTLKKITQVEQLELISSQDREMTATEVVARQREKVMSYARTFTQIKDDFTPFMLRILNCAIELGVIDLKADDTPDFVYRIEDGVRVLNMPKVLYIGRMAQAMEQAQMQNVDTCYTRLSEFAHMNQDADMLMVVNSEKLARGQAIAQGMPYQYLRTPKEVRQLKAELQEKIGQQQAAQARLQNAQAMEHSAKAEAALVKR